MDKADKKEVKKGRGYLVDRYSSKAPERNWDDDSANDDLYGFAADDIDRLEQENNNMKEQRSQFDNLFNSDPMSAALVSSWARGESDPITYLVSKYGDKLKEALESEEGAEKFAKAHQAFLEQEAKDQKADEEYKANMTETMNNLESFAKQHNLSNEQAAELFLKAHSMVLDAIDGKYSNEFFQLVMDGGNYASDVAKAKEQGEIDGRNAVIKRELRKSAPRKNYVPSLSGSGYESEESSAKSAGNMSMFGIPVKKINK